MLIGVYGDNHGLENTPDSPAGCLLPPPKPRVGELLIRKHAKDLGVPVIAAHRAVLTQQLDHKRLPALLHPGNSRAQKIIADDMRRRAACFWATDCGRGCSIRATYQSTTVHLPPALATGNLDVLTNVMVRSVELDKSGKASGVVFIDTTTGKEQRASARIVVLAASACETVRILLNSKSVQFPQGLANSSGKVGRYLMDTVGASVTGQIPRLENLPPHNEDGAGGIHVYSPWWLYQQQKAGKLDFARGYHIEIGSGRRMPSAGTLSTLSSLSGGYGQQFRQDMRRYYGSLIGLSGRGEMIPNESSYCEIDPDGKDRWGIPTLRFHWKWSEHETRQAAHMHKTFSDIIDAMGGRVIGEVQTDGRKAIAPGGYIIHEVGGALMGDDPKSSVVNQWGQSWDVKNLFLTDGAPFVSNADKNPTLTIMALAWRASDYMLAAMKRRDL
jgi:choline dehydrogenase-like flavoprotein